jgi:hypothetical protein
MRLLQKFQRSLLSDTQRFMANPSPFWVHRLALTDRALCLLRAWLQGRPQELHHPHAIFKTIYVERNSVSELSKTAGLGPTASVTEDEMNANLDRLEAARDIFRQNRQLREVLSRLARASVPRRKRGPGIADAQRGLKRDHAGIRPNIVELQSK